MQRSGFPSTDRASVWLAGLIEATEAVAASPKRCDPAVLREFSHRLEMRADLRVLFEPAAMGLGA